MTFNKKFLYIGCGKGKDFKAMRKDPIIDLRSYNKIGMDIDLEICKEGSKKAKKEGYKIICSDAFHLPIKGKSIAIIYFDCFTAFLEDIFPLSTIEKDNWKECDHSGITFCEFLGTKLEERWDDISEYLSKFIDECRIVCSDEIRCYPSCNLELNDYLVNSIKCLPGVTVKVDYVKKYNGERNACILWLRIKP